MSFKINSLVDSGLETPQTEAIKTDLDQAFPPDRYKDYLESMKKSAEKDPVRSAKEIIYQMLTNARSEHDGYLVSDPPWDIEAGDWADEKEAITRLHEEALEDIDIALLFASEDNRDPRVLEKAEQFVRDNLRKSAFEMREIRGDAYEFLTARTALLEIKDTIPPDKLNMLQSNPHTKAFFDDDYKPSLRVVERYDKVASDAARFRFALDILTQIKEGKIEQ